MQKIVGVKFRESGKAYSYDANNLELIAGEKVVVDSASMICIGEVAFIKNVDALGEGESLKKVIRKATAEDVAKQEDLKQKATKDILFVREKVKELGLEMKIVSAQYSLDQSKIVIDFSAEERVDFRDLLKELASALKVRIELHQVGQRDEVKIKGGLGPCGEICCCTRFLKEFEHVTVKMAKNQGLSLSPTKISGLCGRLMCCLAYENKTYEEILKKMPKLNSIISSPKGEGIVVYNDILRERVSVKVKSGDDSFTIYDFTLAELNGEEPEDENKEAGEQKLEKTLLKTFLAEQPKKADTQVKEKENKQKEKNQENKQKQGQKNPQQKVVQKSTQQKQQTQKTEESKDVSNKKPAGKKRHWHFGKK